MSFFWIIDYFAVESKLWNVDCIIQALLKDVVGQKTIVRKLGETIEAVIKRSGRKNSPLADKHQEMLGLFSEIQARASDRRDELLCRLQEVCGAFISFLVTDILDLVNFLNVCRCWARPLWNFLKFSVLVFDNLAFWIWLS